jgi:hypothetical protein
MRSVLLIVACALAASTARAEELPSRTRVVVLDAVVLTPALERANARLMIEQGVMSALREHGWESVSVASTCKDLNCAAAVAAEAKTLYALILSGRFAQGETYAADVGASLWRDGSVIARMTEVEEEAAAQKAGREDAFVRCGPPGACTSKLLETKLRLYSGKLVDDERAVIDAKRAAEVDATAKAAAAAAAVQPVVAPAVPLAPRPDESRSGTRIAGWSLVVVGGILGAGAIALWTQNNSGSECHVDGCRKELHTGRAALAAGIGGFVAAAAGATLLITSSSSSSVALSVHSSGVVLGGTF